MIVSRSFQRRENLPPPIVSRDSVNAQPNVNVHNVDVKVESRLQLILKQIQQGHSFTVDPKRRTGLILCKAFHSEFAGPGASIGGAFDLDCKAIVMIGGLWVNPATSQMDSQKAYRIRRAWLRMIQEFAELNSPAQRAKKILAQFDLYFGRTIAAQIPDHALGALVGVLPQTIRAHRKQT